MVKQVRRDRVDARRLTRMCGAGVVLTMAMLVGCDGGSDRLASEVELIQTRLEAMHTSGGAPAPAGHRVKVYNDTIAKIQDLSGSATEAQQATLALILANVKAGLADIEAQEALGKIAEVTRAGSLVRSALDMYTSQHALADSMLGYSPSEDLASLDEQTAAIESRMAEARRALASSDQELAALRQEAEELRAKAQSERDKASRLEVESLSQPTEARASMIEQARDHLLAAGELERQLGQLQIEIDQIEPLSAGSEDEIVRLQRQLDRLTLARSSVREMDRELTRASEAARQQANEAATEIARRFETLTKLVDDELIPAYDEAMSKLNAAASDAGRARNAGDRSMAQITTGSIASSAAAMAQSQAQAMRHLAALVREMESVRPALPGRERYAQARQRYEELAQNAAGVHAEQSQRASSSFRGAGSGSSRDVYTSLAEHYGGQSTDESDESEESIEDGGAEPGADDAVEPAPDA